MYFHHEGMTAAEVGFVAPYVVENDQGGAGKRESREEVNAREMFMSVNAKYNLGIQSLNLDNNTERAAGYFSAAYNELSGFWKKHPGKVSEDMVRVMVQICRVKTQGVRDQINLLSSLPQDGLGKDAKNYLAESILNLSGVVTASTEASKLDLQKQESIEDVERLKESLVAALWRVDSAAVEGKTYQDQGKDELSKLKYDKALSGIADFETSHEDFYFPDLEFEKAVIFYNAGNKIKALEIFEDMIRVLDGKSTTNALKFLSIGSSTKTEWLEQAIFRCSEILKVLLKDPKISEANKKSLGLKLKEIEARQLESKPQK